MKLASSLKPKKRYIVFEIVSKEKFSFLEVQKAVQEALSNFLGEFGIAKASPLLLKERYKNNKFIIKVGHKHVDEVKAALILIKKIKTIPVVIKSTITSGTIKKASTNL